MAKRKYTKRKSKKKKKSFKLNYVLVFFIIFVISAMVFRKEIRYSYLKIRSIYIVYKAKYATKTEKDKIQKIIKIHENHIFGIDISQYQGIINWNKVGFFEDSIPFSFVMIRATAGNNKEDNYFTYNWREAKSKNIIKGAYHYYRPNENSEEQAKNYIKKVKLKKGDLPPILDIEDYSNIQTMKSLRKGLKNWLELVEKEYHVKPILYTGDRFYNDNIKGQGFEDYPIWIANYNKNIKQPKVKNWVIWQFSDKGKASGIGEFVDLNVFDGNEKVFKLMVLK